MDEKDWPSVTQILADIGLIDRRWFTQAGAQRGSMVHMACGIMAEGYEIDPVWLDRHQDLLPYLDPFFDALNGPLRGFRAEYLEEPIVNETERYRGHPDQMDGDMTTLLELKTGTYPEWSRLQTGGYTVGRQAKRIVVSLPGNGRYKLIEHNDPRDKDRFILLARSWWIGREFGAFGGVNKEKDAIGEN